MTSLDGQVEMSILIIVTLLAVSSPRRHVGNYIGLFGCIQYHNRPTTSRLLVRKQPRAQTTVGLPNLEKLSQIAADIIRPPGTAVPDGLE